MNLLYFKVIQQIFKGELGEQGRFPQVRFPYKKVNVLICLFIKNIYKYWLSKQKIYLNI